MVAVPVPVESSDYLEDGVWKEPIVRAEIKMQFLLLFFLFLTKGTTWQNIKCRIDPIWLTNIHGDMPFLY